MPQLLKWIALGAVVVCALGAQSVPAVGRLSATSNGLAVYGATNLTLRGEPADSRRKIVKYDDGRWVTAIRDRGEGRGYQRIQEDASGQMQIYTATFPCSVPTPICISSEAGIVYWRNRDTGVTWQIGYGAGGVSDNGEWAVTATDVPTPESHGPEVRRVRLMDGRTETAFDYSRTARHPVRRIIANDGTIAMASGGWLMLWKPGEASPQTRRVDQTFESYVIDPAGEFLLGTGGQFHWEDTVPVWDTLYRMDLASGTLTAVVQTPSGIAQPDLASDGHTVVFHSAADWQGLNPNAVKQVWLTDLRSGSKQQLTSEAAHITEVVLAANGSAAFAITENLKVLRIDLVNGATQEIAPEYPRVRAKDPDTMTWARNGRYWLWGRGFADAEIVAGDANAEVLTRSPDDVEFIVPIDAATDENVGRVGARGSPFQPADIGVAIAAAAPAFPGSGGRGTTWLHSDGVTLVTAEHPARLGEMVTARVTGIDDATSVQWSFVESFPPIRGQRSYVRTPLVVVRMTASSEPGILLVMVRLPETLRGGLSRYDGIEAAVPGVPAALSPLPLAVPE